MSGVVALLASFILGGLGVLPSSLHPLLPEPDRLGFAFRIPGNDNMRFRRVGGSSLGLVVAAHPGVL